MKKLLILACVFKILLSQALAQEIYITGHVNKGNDDIIKGLLNSIQESHIKYKKINIYHKCDAYSSVNRYQIKKKNIKTRNYAELDKWIEACSKKLCSNDCEGLINNIITDIDNSSTEESLKFYVLKTNLNTESIIQGYKLTNPDVKIESVSDFSISLKNIKKNELQDNKHIFIMGFKEPVIELLYPTGGSTYMKFCKKGGSCYLKCSWINKGVKKVIFNLQSFDNDGKPRKILDKVVSPDHTTSLEINGDTCCYYIDFDKEIAPQIPEEYRSHHMFAAFPEIFKVTVSYYWNNGIKEGDSYDMLMPFDCCFFWGIQQCTCVLADN